MDLRGERVDDLLGDGARVLLLALGEGEGAIGLVIAMRRVGDPDLRLEPALDQPELTRLVEAKPGEVHRVAILVPLSGPNAPVGISLANAASLALVDTGKQGIRLTTGAEFAARDAAPTPVQFNRLMPQARALFPLGERADDKTWLGARPCFPDSRPVIGRAPGQPGLWLAIGHAHWGLTLGPPTGRLLAEMMAGDAPFCDPAPYRAERFL